MSNEIRANGTYALGTKLAFDYVDSKTGLLKPRTGFVVPPAKSQTESKVVFLRTLEGDKSFSFHKMQNVLVLS